ncbi:ABC transporter permease [Actinoplanes sp. NEAU-A12]|uniref:ABC transporter permease n=1 Tax=Actinoplanes sandaracinus TaxID=3045177 RepID=A0ABT6WM29_9ACTN|nr:ABC transporter permease [Actinoplanes sandaracinus]MDI6100784.1 ABC transporter permease [Actinoplanes sandaracinus]
MADTLAARRARPDILGFLQAGGVYLAIAVLLAFNLAFTPHFATAANLRLQLVQVAPVAIVAIGMALVVASEGIDLSVGSTMAISAAVLPLYLGYGVWPAVAIALLAGAAVGAVNGSLVAFARMQPIIATLGTLVACRGLALVLADGRLTEMFDPVLGALGNDAVLGVPISVLLVLVVTGAAAVAVHRAAFGRRLLAVGGNHAAAALAGLPVKRTLVTVYVVSGVLAATAGVLSTARQGASDPSFVGLLIELSAITAVVVGGTPLSGGRVRIVGTLMGALLMQLITATVIQHDLPDSAARMLQAGIIIAAVYVQRGRSRA